MHAAKKEVHQNTVWFVGGWGGVGVLLQHLIFSPRS